MMFGYNDKRFFHNFITALMKNNKEIKLTHCYQIRNIIFIDELINQFLILIAKIDSIKKININMGAEYEIRLKTFILLISNVIKNDSKKNTLSRLKFGEIKNRKNERIFKSYTCDKMFKKNMDKSVYLKNLKIYIIQELKKYNVSIDHNV